ncbi:phage tail protein [Pediococcus acidilactici]|uniref:phage tail protein n=1 Tax=Pediococcus acidilactici TaxID=1254 RepID=UPI001320E332|nr:phage tail protein [Pediococcus acidilactici]KAF0343804.1 phage tail protein [Pediococcus acidilactici]KAF0353623.1 phage tail protein [Pediococcus acidilactici]KAF0357959.1 phage tail protein [Pediococcus acidilactici]KAF0361782.1 phage tail protein [Pediococcus acidilactici]KAF0408502.1 phage tail protein [Pediococcus acidilactici]
MATVGLKLVTLALKDSETGKIITGENGLSENGLLPVTTQMWGTKTANITNIQAAGTIQYGNNVGVFVSTPKGAPQVALDFNKLPFEVTQKIVGRAKDPATGAWIETGKHPSVALLIESQSIDRLNRVFYGFGNGTMTQASVNNGTDTNAETMSTDALTYQALSTPEFGGEMLAMYSDASKEFDEGKMKKQVFAGYVDPASKL